MTDQPVPGSDAQRVQASDGFTAARRGAPAWSRLVRALRVDQGARGWRAELWMLLELVALCGFVVVQPVLAVVGDSPDFFIFHGVTGAEAMLLVGLLAVVPPVALWAVGVLSRLAGGSVRRMVHLATVTMLLALFMIELGKHLTEGLRGFWLATLAALVALVAVVGYIRFDATRQLLRFAAVGPLVFVTLFAFASPASAVVFPDSAPSAGDEVPVTGGPTPPIVMVVLDELPLRALLDSDGGIDAGRYPNFARLAGDSTWYRNATTVAGWTPYAIPAILTGRMPSGHVAPHYTQYPDNLFSLLGDLYQLEVHESIAQLCPPWHCGDLAGNARGGLPAAVGETSSLLGELAPHIGFSAGHWSLEISWPFTC